MKRALSLFLSLVIVFGICFSVPITVNAASVDDLTFELNDVSQSYSVINCVASASGEIIIPDNYNGLPVTHISGNAFANCSGLTSVEIPSSITYISDNAFLYCSSLKSISVSEKNQFFKSVQGVLFDKSGEYLITYPGGLHELSYTLPDGVKDVCGKAFSGCKSLKNILVSNGNTNFSSVDGVLFDKKQKEIVCYPRAKTDETYIIPTGVEIIGGGAFFNCDYLETVVIPSSVERIHTDAFFEAGISSITIPENVRIIQGNPFFYCNELSSISVSSENLYFKSINGVLFDINNEYLICYPENKSGSAYSIPSGVKYISSTAFGASDFASITIPDTVESVGSGAFDHCYFLETISVSRDNANYTSDAGVLFDKNKTKLVCYPIQKTEKSYIIPNTVTCIGAYAFYNCNFEIITIPGNIKSVGSSAFWGCWKLKKVYYRGNKTDFDKIDIAYYNDSLLNAKIYYNTVNNIAPIETIETNKTNKTLFFFYNSTPFLESNSNDDINLKLNEVYVKYSNTGVRCDKKCSLDLSGITTSNIVFSRENFQDYIIPKTVFDTWIDKKKTYDAYLKKDVKDGKPYISTVFARNLDEENNLYKDATTTTIAVLENSKYDVIVTANSANREKPETYWLSQGEGYKISNTTGEFLSADLYSVFVPNRPVYAYALYSSGIQTEPVQVLLEPKEDSLDSISSFLNTTEIDFFGSDGIVFGVPEDVPLLGGSKIKADVYKIPIGIQVEGNRIRVSLGLDIFSIYKDVETGGDDYILTTKDWTWFKDSCKLLNSSLKKNKEKYKTFRNYMKVNKLGNCPKLNRNTKGISFDVSHFGYAEGYITSEGFVWTEYSTSLIFELLTYYKQQFLVAGIAPFYSYIEGGGELSLELSGSISIPDKNLDSIFNEKDFFIELTPRLKIGGGVGVKDAVSAGFYGKAALPSSLEFPTKHWVIDLTGEVGVEAEFLFVSTGEIPLFEGEINILDVYLSNTQKTTKSLSHNIYEFMNPQYSNSMQSNNSVKLLSRDYADDTSNWLGEIYYPKQHLSSLFGITQDITVKDLQTSVYKNSQLQLIEFNDTMMMAWIEDCEERDDYNRFRLVYSVYNPTFDTWSDPIAVDDNGRNDSAPSLATDGENVYIAWQNLNEIFTTVDDTTTEKILQSTEIKTAKYNSETGLFDSVKTLTDNATYDYAPTISVNDGVATICWVNSATTDFASGTLSVLKNDFSDINTVIAENLNYVTSLETNGNDVSYSMDTDGDLTTDDVYTFTNNIQQTGLEEDSLSTPELTYGLLDNEAVLFFVDACNIRYIKQGVVYDVFADSRAVGGNINVVNNNGVTTLSWTESTGVGTELFASSYENGEWTEPIQLTEFNAIISNIDLVSYNGSLYGAFNRTNLIEETDTDGEVIYTQSSTDICLLKSNGFTDVEVSNVFVDEKTFVKGEIATVSVTVTNNGTETIESIDFNISDGLRTNSDITKNIAIASGATEIIELPYTVPEEFTETSLTISATVESDSNTENNSSSAVVGLTDVSISDMDTEKVGLTYVISGFVNNQNCIDAENVVVRIVSSDSDEELSTVEIGTIAAKETKEVQFFVTENVLEVTTEPKTIRFIAETTSEETLTTNNEGVVAILHDEVDGCEHVYEEWTVTKEATCTETGIQRSICTACGIPNTEIIETKHNYENNLVFDDDKHWRFCADDCGTMLDEELHEFDDYGVCTCGKYEAPENVDGVYQIETERDLMWLAQKVNYGLGSPNVTLKENVYIRADEWLSIGTEDYPYTGVFDGAFNVIYDGTDAGIRGVFGVTENAVIRNFGVEGIYIDIEDEEIENVGIIANKLLNSQVLNCYTQGYVYAPDSVTIGGISVDATGSTLINCYTNVGELTNNAQSVENCYYLSDEENDYGGKTYQQFESGEVTYALNNDVTDGTQLWYQTLGSCGYPQFYGATVYYDDNLSCYYNNVDLLTVADTKTTTVDLNQNIVRTSVTALDYISNILSVPFGYSLEVEPSFNFDENEFLGTSSKINVYLDDVLLVSYTLVVEGDVNGDSVCDALDCMLVQLAITEDLTLEKEYLTAADFTVDNQISVEDFQKIVNRVMESHEIFTFELNDDETGYVLTDCRFDTEGEVVVPSSYYGVPVLSIGKEAFKNCGEITRIAISEGVRTIERDAFYNCGSLKEISFPKSLKKFTDYTLIGACDSLDSVFFGGSNIEWEKLLQYDEDDDMSYVDEFDEFIIHYNSTNHSFSEWETNPSTCDEYGYKNRVCSVCDKIETVYLELEMHSFIDGICTVCETPIFEYDVFDDEVGILGYNGYDEELIIPNQIENCSVTYLEISAFAGNKMLKSVVLPDSINAITNWCFENCTSLEKVTIPKSIQYINSGAFSGCNNLKTIIYTGSRDEWQNIQIGLNSELEKANIIFQEQ